MASFAINQTQVTREPRVVVDAGLRPGLHRFRLVVTDDAGKTSRPDEVVVQISALTAVGGFVPVRRAAGAGRLAVTPSAAPAVALLPIPAGPTAARAAPSTAPPVAARAAPSAATPESSRAAAAAPSPSPKPFRSRPR